MMQFIELLNNLSSIILVVGAFLGFIFRESIIQLLRKKFAVDLEKEKEKIQGNIDESRHKLAQDFENYRMGLDLQHTITLKIADKRMRAYNTVLCSLTDMNHQLRSFSILAGRTNQDKQKLYERLVDSFEEGQKHFGESLLFFSDDLTEKVYNIDSELRSMLSIVGKEYACALPCFSYEISMLLGELRELMMKEIRDNQSVASTPFDPISS